MPNQNRRRPNSAVREVTRQIGGGSYSEIKASGGKATADRIQEEARQRLRNR